MASNVVLWKSRHSITSNKQPVEQEPQKKVSKNSPGTKLKANKQHTCNTEQEPCTKKKTLKDLSMTEPTPKRARKMLNKKERKGNESFLHFYRLLFCNSGASTWLSVGLTLASSTQPFLSLPSHNCNPVLIPVIIKWLY